VFARLKNTGGYNFFQDDFLQFFEARELVSFQGDRQLLKFFDKV
jgi:hypothetical protein